MDQAVQNRMFSGNLLTDLLDLVFLFHVADEDRGVAQQTCKLLFPVCRANDVDDLRAGISQHSTNVIRNALAIGDAKDRDRFPRQLKKFQVAAFNLEL